MVAVTMVAWWQWQWRLGRIGGNGSAAVMVAMPCDCNDSNGGVPIMTDGIVTMLAWQQWWLDSNGAWQWRRGRNGGMLAIVA